MYRFLVVYEKGDTSYGAYAPDLPSCVAVGRTREEVERNMRGAITMHIEGMLEDNEPIPVPQTDVGYVNDLRIQSGGL